MKDRIIAIRKSQGLSQQEFAERLNIKRGTIANYECGRNEPIDAVITLICKEFNVNKNWLLTGNGEMLLPRDRERDLANLTLDLLSDESDSFKNRLVSALARLNEDEWELLEKMFSHVVDNKKE